MIGWGSFAYVNPGNDTGRQVVKRYISQVTEPSLVGHLILQTAGPMHGPVRFQIFRKPPGEAWVNEMDVTALPCITNNLPFSSIVAGEVVDFVAGPSEGYGPTGTPLPTSTAGAGPPPPWAGSFIAALDVDGFVFCNGVGNTGALEDDEEENEGGGGGSVSPPPGADTTKSAAYLDWPTGGMANEAECSDGSGHAGAAYTFPVVLVPDYVLESNDLAMPTSTTSPTGRTRVSTRERGRGGRSAWCSSNGARKSISN